MSRELANAVLNISGAAVYTLTTVKPSDIQAIDFDFVKWVVGYGSRNGPVTAQDAPRRTLCGRSWRTIGHLP